MQGDWRRCIAAFSFFTYRIWLFWLRSYFHNSFDDNDSRAMQSIEQKIEIRVRLPWKVSMKIAVIAVCTGRSWSDVACEMLSDYTLNELVKK